MGERKILLPALESRKSLRDSSDSSHKFTPRTQRYAGGEWARLTQTHSSRWVKGVKEEEDLQSPTSYRSPTIQTKHEILLQLKELRHSPTHLTIKHAKALCQVLQTLSKEKGYYSEEMTFIVLQLQRVLFSKKDDIPTSILQYIYSKDVEVMLQEDGLVPYFYLTSFLYRLIEQFSDKERDTDLHIKQLLEDNERKMLEKDREIADLQDKIDVLKEGLKPIEKKLRETEEENEKLQGSNKAFQLRLEKMEDKYRTAKVALREDLRLISDLESKVKMLNATAMDASNALSSLEDQYQALEKAYLALQDECRNLVQRLVQMEKKLEGVEEEKRKVEEEIYHLKVRAAVGFEELTPRPSFSKLYETLGSEVPPGQRTEAHLQELNKQIRVLQVRLSQSQKPKFTRKMPQPEGRNRSPSVDMFVEEGEEPT